MKYIKAQIRYKYCISLSINLICFLNDIHSKTKQKICINKKIIDPFDSDTINQALIPQGYVYSSGYGLFNKPQTIYRSDEVNIS